MCQRKGQAPDENGGEIKGSLPKMFLLIFLVKKIPTKNSRDMFKVQVTETLNN